MELIVPFSTPIIVFPVADVEEINTELTRHLVAESESTPGVKRAEFGTAWQSEPDLAVRPEPIFGAAIAMLLHHIEQGVHGLAVRRGHEDVPEMEIALRVWATVMRDGDYVSHHDHEDAAFCTTYYADAGEPNDEFPWSGRLCFVEPNRVSGMTMGLDLFRSDFDMEPRTGTLVMYPGYLQHYVHSYRGSRPRVAVSTAIRIKTRGGLAQPNPYGRLRGGPPSLGGPKGSLGSGGN